MPDLWHWQVALAFAWRRPGHINELEVRAALSSFRWTARHHGNLRAAFLHLLDSQVTLSVLAKKRSTSHRLMPSLRKFCALGPASMCEAAFAFCRSETNPADRPSRWAEAWPAAGPGSEATQE